MNPRGQGSVDTKSQYIVDDKTGMLVENPNYIPNGQEVKPTGPTTLAAPTEALKFTSSVQESVGLPLSESASTAVRDFNRGRFSENFQVPVDTNENLKGLTKVFGQYEIQFGLVNKLKGLVGKNLTFVVDDSPSMIYCNSDLTWANASTYTKNKYRPQDLNACMNRWQEAEDNLYILGQILKYIPINTLTLTFLNRDASQDVKIDHRGLQVEDFGQKLDAAIDNIFKTLPADNTGTPLYGKLKAEYEKPKTGDTVFYVLTDGEPNDVENDNRKIEDLIVFRGLRPQHLNLNRSPSRPGEKPTSDEREKMIQELIAHAKTKCYENPTHLLSCSDNNNEVAWMKRIEAIAPATAEVDDCHTESQEVLAAQGPTLPYTRGTHLICQLVAALPGNEHDLDALDESAFTKYTLDNFLGRITTETEYDRYLNTCPRAQGMPPNIAKEFKEKKALAQIILQNHKPTLLEEYIRTTPHIEPPLRYANSSANNYQNQYSAMPQQNQGNYGQPSYQNQQTSAFGNQNQSHQQNNAYGFNNQNQGFPQQSSQYGFGNQNQQQGGFGYSNQNQSSQQGKPSYPSNPQQGGFGYPGNNNQQQFNQQGFFGRSNQPMNSSGFGNAPQQPGYGNMQGNPGNPQSGYGNQSNQFNPGMWNQPNQQQPQGFGNQNHGQANNYQNYSQPKPY